MIPWLWVVRTLGGQAAKRYGKKKSKKWVAKQAARRGGRRVFPPPTAPFHMIPKGKGKRKSKRGLGSAVKKDREARIPQNHAGSLGT